MVTQENSATVREQTFVRSSQAIGYFWTSWKSFCQWTTAETVWDLETAENNLSDSDASESHVVSFVIGYGLITPHS